MKSILIAGVSLMTSLQWAFRELRRQTIGTKVGVTAARLLLIASIASIPVQAATIGISYSNAGDLTGPPVLNGTILTLDAIATGSIISGNPALNAIWNPATFHTHDFLDLTTGLDNGIFSITFANGDILSGNLFEVQSAEVLATNTGPFTQILTFTGGTGAFAGASGSVSGEGLVEAVGFTVSGTGTLTAPGIPTPEPASVALIFGGLLVMFASRKLVRQHQ